LFGKIKKDNNTEYSNNRGIRTQQVKGWDLQTKVWTLEIRIGKKLVEVVKDWNRECKKVKKRLVRAYERVQSWLRAKATKYAKIDCRLKATDFGKRVTDKIKEWVAEANWRRIRR